MFQQKNRGNVITLIILSTFLIISLTAASIATTPIHAAVCSPTPQTPGPDEFGISGTVLDPDGQPAECVEVFAFNAVQPRKTETAADGTFTIALSQGSSYDIIFNPPIEKVNGRYPASQIRRGITESYTNDLDIRLNDGFLISGTIHGYDGASVGGTDVYAFNLDRNEGMGLTPAASDGSYAIVLEPGNWELTFTPPPFSGYSQTTLTPFELTGDLVKDVVLPPGYAIYGVISAPDGTPQPNVEIFAQDPHKPSGHGFRPSDENGSYANGLPPGTYEIQYMPPPFSGAGATVETGVTIPPNAEVNVTLPFGHTVYGQVTMCGEGVANAFIFAAPESGVFAGHFFGGWGRFVGSDGRYGLALQPGTYAFIVVPPPQIDQPDIDLPSIDVSDDLVLDFAFACDEPPQVTCDPDTPGAILGTEGKDLLIGTPGDDVILGFGGNDRIYGRGGNDCIDGGDGRDLIRGLGGDDDIFGGAGNDLLSGGTGNDRLWGDAGDDLLQGESGDDILDGGEGWDRLNGRSGTNTCRNGELIKRCGP